LKVINFISGPGAGKSTLCAGLFHYMKKNGHDVEYVHEWAKELTWDERYRCLKDQISILGHQNNMLDRLKGKVDVAITDSCILLGLLYTPEEYFKYFEPLLVEVYKSYDNVNVFVERPDTYVTEGRNQTHEEAKAIDRLVLGVLEKYDVPYIECRCDIDPEDLYDKIFNES